MLYISIKKEINSPSEWRLTAILRLDN